MKQGQRKLCAIAVATSIVIFVLTAAWNPRIRFQTHGRYMKKKEAAGTAFTFQNWRDKSTSLAGVLEAPSTKSKGVIYNRVGKCGSRSLIKIIEAVSARNRFKLVGVHENLNRRLTLVQQIDFVSFVERIKTPFVYHQHVRFVDFRRFAAVQPYYINLIRDPVKRVVSQYYFKRFGDGRKGERRGFKGTEQEFNQTFDECVLNEKPECTDTKKLFSLIPYFCGQRAACSHPTQWALKQAKLNVISNYVVVGVLEEFHEFLLVLEKILPGFFSGAVEMWRSPGPTLKAKMAQTETKRKKEPPPNVVRIVRRYLQLEYQFYDFVKERFHALRAELGVYTGNRSTSVRH